MSATNGIGFGDISERKLKNLGLRLEKIDDTNGMDHHDALKKLVPFKDVRPLLWHLVETGLVAAHLHPGMLRLLSEDPTDASSPRVVTDLVCQLPESYDDTDFPAKDRTELLENYSFSYDRLLFFAYRNDRENLMARQQELAAPIRLGLSFIRGRLHEEIPDDDRRQILRQLAICQCRSGLVSSGGLRMTRSGGEYVAYIEDLDELRQIATLFGSDEEWDRCLVDAALTGEWGLSIYIEDAIRTCKTQELATLLYGGEDSSLLGTSTLEDAVLNGLESREDDPEALYESVMACIEEQDWTSEGFRELLGLTVAARYGACGKVPPEELDALFTGGFVSNRIRVMKFALQGFGALPRERALNVARRGLESSWLSGWELLPLAAHFDQTLFEAAVTSIKTSTILRSSS